MLINVWTSSIYQRIYHDTLPKKNTLIRLEGVLNDKFSFQVSARADENKPLKLKAVSDAPKDWQVRVRKVGYVPVRHRNTSMPDDPSHNDGIGHLPGFTPDPLFNEDTMVIPANETNSFWITVTPPTKVKAGKYKIDVTVSPVDVEGPSKKVSAEITVHNLKLEKRKDFNVTNWFYIDSLLDWYKLDAFDEKFWTILEAYFRDMAEHGQDVVYVPAFTPPLDGVKRPSQLLKVKKLGKDKYSFDWSDVRKYVKLAKKCGLEIFEWVHPVTQWGAKNAIRIYEGQGESGKLIFAPELEATSSTYKKFLKQYFDELLKLVKEEKILNKSFFHLSDEPHGPEHRESYKKAREMFREIAPWMKIMDALSEIEFAKEKLTDIPVPSISRALDFVKEDIECWCYYCCGPRGKFLNRLMDTPLAKIAMHGLLFYRWPFKGFLHWGYNYWYQSQTRNMIDPFTVQDGKAFDGGGWAYGDTFMVYPGENGPIDSIRWEIFAESLRDYQLLQTLGIDRNDKMLKDLVSFEDFPVNSEWRLKLRSKLFKRISKK